MQPPSPPPTILPSLIAWINDELYPWVLQATTLVNNLIDHEVHEGELYEAGLNLNMHTLVERLRHAHREFEENH